MTEASLPAGWPAMSIAQAHALLTAPGLAAGDRGGRGRRREAEELEEPAGQPACGARGLRAHADKVFLVYENERVTFNAFNRAVSVLAHDLVARGVTKGDRVAVIMRNVPEMGGGLLCRLGDRAIVTPR